MRLATIAFTVSVATLASLAGGSSALAVPLVVDGNATDWGFTVADNNGSTFVPAKGLNLLNLMVEDADDNAGDEGYNGPSKGGQNYDAEALAAATQAGNLFIVIVTGQRPDNGLTRYAPGDIRIDTSDGFYGVEVGGGAGGGPGGALTEGSPGSTYQIDGDGFAVGTVFTPAHQTTGSIWLNPNFISFQQLRITGGGTHVGDADYIYTRDTVTTQHAVIELSIPLSIFEGRTIKAISWDPACRNDELKISHLHVPEPPSIVLLALAGGWLMVRGRRRK